MADEIAQISHDIDDGIASGLVSYEELESRLKEGNLNNLKQHINKKYESYKNKLEKAKNDPYNRQYIDEKDILREIIVPVFVNYLINKVVKDSSEKIEDYIKKAGSDNKIIKENLIITKKEHHIKLFRNIILSNIINSYEVNFFDGKSSLIIEELFQAYYDNPRLLPDNTINRIMKEVQVFTKNYTNLRKGNKDKIEEELSILKGEKTDGNKELNRKKAKIYIRGIADFIAGMTDNYAKEQYKKMFMV